MLATTDGQGQPRSANAVKSPQNRKKKKKTSPASYFKRFFFVQESGAGMLLKNSI